MQQVDNSDTESNPVGRFMVAVGAVVTNSEGQILLIKRSSKLDWQPGLWEIVYGRLAQYEDPQLGLVRELQEELGITVTVGSVLRIWHIYRGHEQTSENELIGITFVATTNETRVTLSDEHQEYRWVTPQEALKLLQVDGIKEDIHAYLKLRGLSSQATH